MNPSQMANCAPREAATLDPLLRGKESASIKSHRSRVHADAAGHFKIAKGVVVSCHDPRAIENLAPVHRVVRSQSRKRKRNMDLSVNPEQKRR